MIPDPRTVLFSALCGALFSAIVTGLIVYKIEHASVIAAKSETVKLQANIAAARGDAIAKVREKEIESAKTIADISALLHQREAENAQLENDRDAAIAAGTQRVHVRARCPAGDGMPATTAAAGGADAAAPELDPAYRSALSDLRRRAQAAAEQIIGLQSYARECQRVCR